VSERYRVTSLDSIEALPGPGSLSWLPVRHELGIGAFGTNAYVARKAGDDVVEPHKDGASGHEELYFVARGAATFTLDGEEVPAPAGTYVFIPDPEVHRRAVADEAGTTVLSFGAPRGEVYTVSGWEARFRATAIRERDPEQARALYEEALVADPQNPWAQYDLACWHALYGSPDGARRLLERAIERGGDEVREHAAKDPDLVSLRDDEAPA
jgi:hypothetical protein